MSWSVSALVRVGTHDGSILLDTFDGSDPGPADLRLDPQARRFLAILATGLTTAEAADRLEIEPEAVRRHLRRAMRVLGARSKLQAVVVGLRLGLITLDED